ncbi:DenA endonuclease II [Aeromonas phage Aeh1]|uniref:DenA endonuclease II n=1 Tax=Aeromonas phage Aeh1 TaxID=2880362 RepID=Q76YC5_9CAUD|nr:endonuclease [Aeromonas phage Aeh1]AAQ17970.1 DenA endonuclease II [Aeromonas phage Aeh1]
MSDLTKFGFKKMCDLSLDKEGKIDRSFVKPKQMTFVLYAFVVNGVVHYIGKTNDLWKRFDTYRNSKNWKNAFVSNQIKTDLLEKTIAKTGVELYVKECPTFFIGSNSKAITVTSMHLEEPKVIKHFNPEWNKHYAKYQRAVPKSY